LEKSHFGLFQIVPNSCSYIRASSLESLDYVEKHIDKARRQWYNEQCMIILFAGKCKTKKPKNPKNAGMRLFKGE